MSNIPFINVGISPSQPYLFLPDGWDAGWKKYKALANQQPIRIAAIGDSITQGIAATNQLSGSWFGKVRTYLLSQYALYGDYYPTVDNSGFSGGTGLPWSMPVGPSWSGASYLQNPYWSQTAVLLATFTTPYACTAVDIIWGDNGGTATWQYRVDGGVWQTVTPSAATFETKRISISGLTNTTHTIDFGNQTALNTMFIEGCCIYTGVPSGLGFVRMGAAGQTMSDLQVSTFNPSDRIRLWAGVTPQSGAAQTAATGFGFPMQPHLAFITLGVNDCIQAKSTTDYQNGLTRYINAIRRGQPNASIILIGPSFPDVTHSDLTSGTWANPLVWPSYLAIMRQMAEVHNCAFIDVHAKWGDYGATNGFQSATDPHPTDVGHDDIASLITSIL